MNTVNRVVIVGAGAAGVDCAAELRRLGFTGQITLLGAETHQPYDRPPLSKEYLTGAWAADKITLQPPGFYDQNAICLRLGEKAAGLSVRSRAIMTATGRTLQYDALVVATGLRPRRLATWDRDDDRVLTLRTQSDAAALRDRLAGARRVAVIGTGYLGCELAASCRMLGARVTLVGPDPTLLGRQLGPAVGQIITRIHCEQDVDVRTGASVVGIQAEGAARRVVLTDGSKIAADVVIVAVGSEPNSGWLAASGLAAPEGVRCDETLLAAPGVWAAGDIAAIKAGPAGGWHRSEHRMHATESAFKAATGILGGRPALPPVPYAWTDQFTHRIQIYGRVPVGASPVFTHVDPAGTSFVAIFPASTGDVVAAVGCDAPKATRLARAWVAERRPLADVPDAGGRAWREGRTA